MAASSNIDYLREIRDQHLDNIKLIMKEIDDYHQSDKCDVSDLIIYQDQLENEWKQFRFAQEDLYDLDEENDTLEREALVYYLSVAARLVNLIEGRRSSTPLISTGSQFSAKYSPDNSLSLTTDNGDYVINESSTDDTASSTERFDCSRNAALRHSLAIINFRRINEASPTALSHLISTVEENLQSLDNLGKSVTLNGIIISLISSKLPAKIMQQWQFTLPNKKVPQYTHLLNFLKKLVRSSDVAKADSTVKRTKRICPICGKSHKIWKCDIFRSKSINERLKDVEAASLCINCLREGHSTADCYAGSCLVCGEWHNTMLHKEKRYSNYHSVTSTQIFSSSNGSPKVSSTSSSSPIDHRKSTTKRKSGDHSPTSTST